MAICVSTCASSIYVHINVLDTEGIDTEGLKFTFKNFAQLKEPSTIIALLNSLKFSIISTVICILLGYITAYYLYKSHLKINFFY